LNRGPLHRFNPGNRSRSFVWPGQPGTGRKDARIHPPAPWLNGCSTFEQDAGSGSQSRRRLHRPGEFLGHAKSGYASTRRAHRRADVSLGRAAYRVIERSARESVIASIWGAS
jgi:hypothetical protein